jgi:hypothetical protein
LVKANPDLLKGSAHLASVKFILGKDGIKYIKGNMGPSNDTLPYTILKEKTFNALPEFK